jgi:transmembrane sensor
MSRRSKRAPVLPLPIKQVLAEPFDELAMARMLERRAPASTPRTQALWVLVPIAAVAALAWMWPPALAEELESADGGSLDIALTVDGLIELADGSQIGRTPGTVLTSLRNDAHEIAFLLEEGTSTFDVVPHGPRRWTIECGLATVEVVGTQFTIERSAERLVVSVARGRVLVRGERVPDGARALGPGESLTITANAVREPAPPPGTEARAESVTNDETHDDHESSGTPPSVSGTVRSAPSAETRRVDSRWRALADERRWDEAYQALGPSGVERATERAPIEDLLALADLARLSGHPAEAIAPLRRVVDEHPSDARAGLAAFSLGRVESQLGHPLRAANAFREALVLGLPVGLEEDAMARSAEALGDAGDRSAARDAAHEYLRAHPEGAHAMAMRALENDDE